MPFEFNDMNQVTAGADLQFTYDDNGCLHLSSDGASFLKWYFHDSQRRLVGYGYEDLDTCFGMDFGYDTAGRLLWRTTADGKMLKYYYDGNNVVLEKESVNGASWYTKVVYTLGPGNIHQIIAETRPAYPSDWTGTGLTRWYHYDLAGSVVALSDDAGVPMVKYDQDAYGRRGIGSLTPSPRRHLTGKEYDPDMGLYYFGARWYDPYTAQWIEPEPTGADGPNLYWYGRNDVVNGADPSGEKWNNPFDWLMMIPGLDSVGSDYTSCFGNCLRANNASGGAIAATMGIVGNVPFWAGHGMTRWKTESELRALGPREAKSRLGQRVRDIAMSKRVSPRTRVFANKWANFIKNSPVARGMRIVGATMTLADGAWAGAVETYCAATCAGDCKAY